MPHSAATTDTEPVTDLPTDCPAPRKGLRRTLRDLANPGYHFRKMAEDFSAAYHALRNWNFTGLRSRRDALAKAFRGKFFAAFFFSGGFGLVAAGLATSVQYQTRNPYLSVVLTLVFSLVLTTMAFQAFWAVANVDFYRATASGFWGRFKQLQRDLWPIHATALRVAPVFASIAIPVNTLIAWLFSLLPNEVGAYIPMPPIVLIVNWLIIDGTFIRIMCDRFDTQSQVMADQYWTPETVAPR